MIITLNMQMFCKFIDLALEKQIYYGLAFLVCGKYLVYYLIIFNFRSNWDQNIDKWKMSRYVRQCTNLVVAVFLVFFPRGNKRMGACLLPLPTQMSPTRIPKGSPLSSHGGNNTCFTSVIMKVALVKQIDSSVSVP